MTDSNRKQLETELASASLHVLRQVCTHFITTGRPGWTGVTPDWPRWETFGSLKRCILDDAVPTPIPAAPTPSSVESIVALMK